VPRCRVTRNDGPKTALPAVAGHERLGSRHVSCRSLALPNSTAVLPLVRRQARVLIPKATVKPSTVTRPVAGPLCS
jgi:hypothetical protein